MNGLALDFIVINKVQELHEYFDIFQINSLDEDGENFPCVIASLQEDCTSIVEVFLLVYYYFRRNFFRFREQRIFNIIFTE